MGGNVWVRYRGKGPDPRTPLDHPATDLTSHQVSAESQGGALRGCGIVLQNVCRNSLTRRDLQYATGCTAPGAGFERPSLKRWIVRGVAAILSQDQNSCGLRSEGWRGKMRPLTDRAAPYQIAWVSHPGPRSRLPEMNLLRVCCGSPFTADKPEVRVGCCRV